jgi:CAAX prenyl protease-like protein
VAAGGLHASAGTLFVCAIALGLAVSAQRVPWLLRVRETALAAASPTAAYLAPLLAIIVTALLTTAVSTGTIDLFYGARVVVAGAVLWRFRSRYRNLGWTASWGAVAAGVGVFGLWVALGAATPDLAADEALRGELTRMPAGLALCWMAFRVAGSVVTAPLAEELAFRGYLVRRFIARDVETVSLRTFSWRAAVGSSLLFGALHEAWVAGTLAGLAYALVLARRGQLGDPVVAHATTNALLAGYAVATGSWSVMG